MRVGLFLLVYDCRSLTLPGDASNPKASPSQQAPSMEDRVRRLEDEVRKLRMDVAELHPAPSETGLVPFSNATRPAAEKPRAEFFSPWFRPLTGLISGLVRFLGFCLTPGVRQVLLLGLTVAILASNWWLPFSSLWVLGPLWERVVLLALAGVWWWLLLGGTGWWGGKTRGKSPGDPNSPRTPSKSPGNGPNRPWFGSIAG
jgi:hypothetical protein